ncbi:hypothetical protein [Pelagimonas varians]|uniref:Uncharacterized protein n=1 Tax=Pelagimonas varians TaxID=696760 RepID=A0A238K6C9_9RHOB|nr:hypothetical protein [Pelagimonas varians]PYG31896.1 hypothetical protein C8N36_104321 [Pelagimonas varians]SMX38461.1 hypothetical protein PEV8663_01323 [Pelagimonas varians]
MGVSSRLKITYVFLIGLWVLVLPVTAKSAEQWLDYDLPGLAFSVPADWEITYRRRDVEYNFASPDGTYTLWVRWWFPDEPLLGYDDIVFHDFMTLAGHDALLTRTESEIDRFLSIAFPEHKNADGEIILFQLFSPIDLPVAAQEEKMNQLIEKLSIQGQSARPPSLLKFSQGAQNSDPAQVAQSGQGSAVDRFYDRDAQFSLPKPEGWNIHTAQGAGVSQVAVVAPDHDAMVLALVARGAQAQTATDQALGLLYRDALVVKSIEADLYLDIEDMGVHAIETIAKIYAINGIAMPYPNGRVTIFQGQGDDISFVIVTIRSEGASDALRLQLDDIALGFSTAAVEGGAADPGLVWLAPLNDRFGGNCRLEPLENWSHPTRAVMEDANVTLHFVALCQNGVYPVFGVGFPYDPQGATSDYFHPLYIKMMTANGGWSYSFLSVVDNMLSNVFVKNETTLSLAVEDLFPVQPQSMAIDPAGETNKADNTAAPPKTRNDALVFDGQDLAGWDSFAFDGADYAAHVKLEQHGLRFAIPDGAYWGKTGLVYRQEQFAFPEKDNESSIEISVRFDADASNSLTIALVDPANAMQNPWDSHAFRFQIRKNETAGDLMMTVRDAAGIPKARFPWPNGSAGLKFILRPDDVFELRNDADVMLARWQNPTSWPKGPWSLAVYAQVPWKNSAASLLLNEVSVTHRAIERRPNTDQLGARDIALFDGTALAPLWAPIENAEDLFLNYARLADGALRIQWPQDVGYAKYIGLYSPEPALWLDQFDDTASARITVEMDGGASNGFEIGLQQPFGLHHNMLDRSAWTASWRRQTDGSFTFRSAVENKDVVVLAEGLASIPDQFDIVLTSQGVVIEAGGLPSDPVPWTQLMDGAGLRLWLYALKSDVGSEPSGLVLRNIALTYEPGKKRSDPKPAAGVDPLPEKVLFDGATTTNWVPMSQGDALFGDLASITGTGLLMERRDTPPNANRIGLASKDKVVVLDERLLSTSHVTTFQLDPKKDNLAGWIYLASNPDDPYDTAGVAVDLQKLHIGPDAGGLRVRLYSGHMYYSHAQRVLPENWFETWDGSVRLVLSDGKVAVELGDTPAIAMQSDKSRRGQSYHIVVKPGQRKTHLAEAIALGKITATWRTPNGMSQADRWRLVDDADFDAGAFADLMAIERLEMEND